MRKFLIHISLSVLSLFISLSSCEIAQEIINQQTNLIPANSTLSITVPTNNQILYNNNLSIRGIYSNLNNLSLNISPISGEFTNTFTATQSGNQFLAIALLDKTGYYYIWMTGVNQHQVVNNSSKVFFRYELTNTVQVTNDITPPSLSISSPTNLQNVGFSYSITGNASDNESGVNQVMVSVNSEYFTNHSSASGQFNIQVNLINYGDITNRIFAINGNGISSSTQTIIVKYQQGKPSINITSPVNNILLTNAHSLLITGTASVDDSSTISQINVNFNQSGYSEIDNTSWHYTAALVEGTNTFLAKAITANQLSSETPEYILIKDTTGPQLTIENPLDNSVITQSNVLISGTVNDTLSGVKQVFLSMDNAGFESITGTDNWAVMRTLAEGNHNIRIYAVDYLNNFSITNSLSFVITNIQSGIVSNNPPTVTILPSETTHDIYARIYLSASDDNDSSPSIYYTTNGTTPTLSSLSYTGPFNISASRTVQAIAVDTEGVVSTVVSQSYLINDAFKIYFKKPVGWSTDVRIHHWDSQNSDGYGDTGIFSTWPGDTMTDEGSGWYSYSFPSGTRSWLMFVDANNPDIGGNRTSEMQREGAGWYDTQWYDVNPDVGQPPTLSASPAGGYITTNQIQVVLSLSGNNIETSKYTIDGTDPANGITFTNGTSITIGNDMNIGDQLTLKLYANNPEGTANQTYTFTRTNIVRPDYKFSLGAVYTPEFTTFAIWSPDTGNVTVELEGVSYNLVSTNVTGYENIYYTKISGNHYLKKYQLKVNGNGVRDPYGVMVASDGRNVVMDLDSTVTDPEGGWVATPVLENREDAIIYEVHVRDFTLDSSSGVDADKRGKFLGMVQSGTTYNGYSTGIDHLLELGVTHVQLLPTYDFYTSQYNWGYDPWNYNIPEEQYSMYNQDQYEERIKEYKTMINEFHKAGIRVIIDVVYNHTFNKTVFEGISSQYYHSGEGLSGCGNSVNDGVNMISKFIRDSLEFWVEEYNVDGFRFDLIGIFYYDNVRQWGEYLNQQFPDQNLLIYGEPWNGYATDPNESQKVRYGTTAAMASGHVGVFNGGYRENIKGDNDGTARGWMFGNVANDGWGIFDGIRGSLRDTKDTTPIDTWARKYCYDPEQTINYISAHDNYCLWDKIKHCGEDNDFGVKIDKFGMGIVFTSQGLSFIHAGDEFLRTKVYNNDWTYAHNSYNAPDEYNKIYWNWKQDNYDVFSYYKDFIALRKAHPALRMTTWDEINTYLPFSNMYHSQTLITSHITYPGDELFIVYNNGTDSSVNLPTGTWTKIADINGAANETGLSTSYTCGGTTVTVFEKQ